MLGLRASEEGPSNPVNLADNVGIVDHDVSVDAANKICYDKRYHPYCTDLKMVVIRTVTS